ncbi:hypothetical protein E4P41_20680 [Geodermatophilus sp. DF01-2]|uniref:glycosyltransferase n=1 Tax=Geodermatophilus sp. DF01-2 TaxID=2559610 RepID=UPI0010732492|nr:hypothetical protein [Geodermatophilus sp. DF01_2]TFV53884.1 hypothetical protein E4P41_20680 [Geodermatophilus sp. DF01_2]
MTYIAPTAGVAAGLKQADGYTALVQPFAPFRAARRLSEAERESARRRWNVEKDAVVLLLLGGWWRAKNSHVVLRAVASAETPATLIVAGTPLDIPAMNRLRLRDDGRKIKAIDRPLNQRELRELYALASATIVSRRPGVLKESGLVLDAANYGVPLLISDHDEHLNDQLRHEEWVRVFPSGDECALAEAIDGLRCNPVARPDADAPLRLGLKCPTGLIDYFFEQAGANGLNDLR